MLAERLAGVGMRKVGSTPDSPDHINAGNLFTYCGLSTEDMVPVSIRDDFRPLGCRPCAVGWWLTRPRSVRCGDGQASERIRQEASSSSAVTASPTRTTGEAHQPPSP